MPSKRLTFVNVAEISLPPAGGRYTCTLGGLTIENDEPIFEKHIFQTRVGSTTLSQSSSWWVSFTEGQVIMFFRQVLVR